jgi:outer membrane scaffolding protein for murein synthesis (MipA/OmpV family)
MHFYKHLLLAPLLGVISPALAATNDNNSNENTSVQTQTSASSTRISLGIGVVDSPRYVGSDQQRLRLMPVLSATWGNGWFAGFPRGIGYNFSTNPYSEFGLRLTADHGRKQTVSAALNGLGDIGARAELGGFYNLALSKQVKLNTSLRYGAGSDSKGMLLDASLNYRLPLAENRFASFGIATTYANSNYMQSYYGVTAAQSTSSGYAVYTPSAGIREVSLTASYTYKIDRQWAVVTGASFGELGSAVKNAPMSRSNTHNSLHISSSYTF